MKAILFGGSGMVRDGYPKPVLESADINRF
jgi:hypothetical protein